MSTQALIFDMDGVLVDSEAGWYQAAVSFAREAGRTRTEHDHDACMGSAPEEWARYMREHLDLRFSLEDIAPKVTERVRAQYQEQLPLLLGAVQAVHEAASAHSVALASGSPSGLID